MAKIVYNKRRRTELWLVLGVLFGLFSIGFIRTVNGLPESNESSTASPPSLATATTISSLATDSTAASAAEALDTTTINPVTEKKIIDGGKFVIFQSYFR